MVWRICADHLKCKETKSNTPKPTLRCFYINLNQQKWRGPTTQTNKKSLRKYDPNHKEKKPSYLWWRSFTCSNMLSEYPCRQVPTKVIHSNAKTWYERWKAQKPVIKYIKPPLYTIFAILRESLCETKWHLQALQFEGANVNEFVISPLYKLSSKQHLWIEICLFFRWNL